MGKFKHDIEIAVALKRGAFERAHLFEERDVAALDAALASRRPLLLRGDPGVGKSQLAEAAAQVLKRPFVSFVVDQRTDVQELKWREDLVQRLADAQVRREESTHLDLVDYIIPGPLWWAFNWKTAEALKRSGASKEAASDRACSADQGVVVLIDEIDKADPDLPNGLLEALGAGQFLPRGLDEPVVADKARWPLVIITTNRERPLPDAFMRRCVVHDLVLPDDDGELKNFLVTRGLKHFPEASDICVQKAAEMTVEDRNRAKNARLYPLPGQAEFLDLLRAVLDPEFDDPMAELERLGDFFLKKKTDHRS